MVSSNAASFTPKHEGKQICKKIQSSTVNLPVLHSSSHVCLLCRGKHPKSSASNPATSSNLKIDSAPTQPPQYYLYYLCSVWHHAGLGFFVLD